MGAHTLQIIGCFLLGLNHATSFYLPGVAPTSYSANDLVPLTVNSLTPAALAEQESVVSFDYYKDEFHFCRPLPGDLRPVQESLGAMLFGDRIYTSPFELRMLKDEKCKILCTGQRYDAESAKFVNTRIRQSYNMNWLVDGYPAASYIKDETDKEYLSVGFPLGYMQSMRPTLNNHYDIKVEYHEIGSGDKKQYRVVGVVVVPSSKTPKGETGKLGECGDSSPTYLDESATREVSFSYSVTWEPSTTAWATRWDKYLHVENTNIHWFSLMNSTVMVVFLSGMVAMVLLRALRKDIARYNQMDLDEDVQEDSGWKLVHGDVFRSPRYSLLLSALLGSGAQLFFMGGTTIVFALLGLLSPSLRGSLTTSMILLYTLFSFVGSYVSARSYKSAGGENWKLNVVLTPVLIPGIMFGSLLFLNFFLIYRGSSGAVPVGTFFTLILMWFVLSLPLAFAGSWFGLKAAAIQPPVRTNQIPRQIPPQALWFRTLPSMFIVGIIPFAAISLELHFILNSIWFHKYYYMFGFLFVCYGMMILTCSTITVLMIYFSLCSENYHWQWRAFLTSGMCAFYVFLNSLISLIWRFRMGSFASIFLYIGWSAIISLLLFVLTGTIGYFASWIFVRRIYASIKID